MHAQIDPSGKAIMTVQLADMDAVAVHEGTTEQLRQPPSFRGTGRPGWKGSEEFGKTAAAASRYIIGYGLSVKKDEAVAARKARLDEVQRDMASLASESDDRL